MRIGNDPEGPWDMMSPEDEILTPEERSTNPDLSAAAAVAKQRMEMIEARTKELRDRINKFPKHSRRQEVMARIIDRENLYEDELKNLRMAGTQGKDLFMEFQCKCERTVSYIYLSKDYKNPDYLVKMTNSPRRQVPFKHPGGTVLLKINMWNDSMEEIHRWEDDDE